MYVFILYTYIHTYIYVSIIWCIMYILTVCIYIPIRWYTSLCLTLLYDALFVAYFVYIEINKYVEDDVDDVSPMLFRLPNIFGIKLWGWYRCRGRVDATTWEPPARHSGQRDASSRGVSSSPVRICGLRRCSYFFIGFQWDLNGVQWDLAINNDNHAG